MVQLNLPVGVITFHTRFTWFVSGIIVAVIGLLFMPHVAMASSKVSQITTGYSHACAVVDYKASCWGSNASGQLGTGRTSNAAVTTPQAVAQNKDPITEIKNCNASLFGVCMSWAIERPYSPASPLAGKSITKISAGYNHTCVIASAKVYCWGDNSRGQLGNRSKTGSSVPVVVDTKAAWTQIEPAHCDGSSNWLTGCAAPTGTWVPEKRTDYPASALARKEVIDISAAEYYTCALASDGSVACWGEGDDGRLGTNKADDSDYPAAVYSQGALVGKKGIRLAKASGNTMCVLAIGSGETSVSKGNPYCWGKGIGDSTLPADTAMTTACDKNAPVSKPNSRSTDTIYRSLQPVAISTSQQFSLADANGYVTGLSTDGKAYYWGMYGHRATESYADVRECKVNPCTGKVSIMQIYEVTLAKVGGTRAGFTPNGRNQSAYSSSRGLRVTPAVHDSAQANTGGGNACTAVTHYGYTKKTHYNQIGQRTPTVPPANPLTQSKVTALSGEVFGDDVSRGLYCAAKTDGTVWCDSNGTSSSEGQTGSDYTPRCTTTSSLFFATTTCDPAPAGPQAVIATGWLAGKSVTALSTGKTGYTCAIASGAVGCWGMNDKGQLGTGDTVNRRVPTGVGL